MGMIGLLGMYFLIQSTVSFLTMLLIIKVSLDCDEAVVPIENSSLRWALFLVQLPYLP